MKFVVMWVKSENCLEKIFDVARLKYKTDEKEHKTCRHIKRGNS